MGKPTKATFSHLIPGGRGTRRDEDQIDQKESYERRGRDVQRYRDDIPHAFMYISTPAATAVTAGTWVKVAGTTTLVDGHWFDMPQDMRLRYTGPGIKIHSWFQANTTATSSVNNTELYIIAYLNGSPITGTQIDRKISVAGDIGAMGLGGFADFDRGDCLEIWVNTDKNANVTFSEMSIILMSYAFRQN